VVMLALLVAMKGQPAAPGWFAGTGLWSVEAGGSRVALAAEYLEKKDGDYKYHVNDSAPEPTVRGLDGTVNFTVLQVSLFFSIYVFFQVWNQISCRSLTPEVSGF